MSIELRCPGCQNLLRVPDTAAGKQARCPQCQQIVNVPSATPPAESPFVDPPAAPEQKPAFSSTPYQAPDVSNPYAASGFYEQQPVAMSYGELTPQRTTFDDVLQTTWKVFQANLGPLAILGVFVFAVAVAQSAISVPITLLTSSYGAAVRVGVALALQVVSLFFVPIMTLGLTIPCLQLLRTGVTVPGDFLKFTPFYGTELVKSLLLQLILTPFMLMSSVPMEFMKDTKVDAEILTLFSISMVGSLVACIVSAFVIVVFSLSTPFVADRGAGAVEALGQSWKFMRGNRLTMLFLMFVVGLTGGLFACCTVGVGMVLLYPFFALMTVVTYLQVTGQANAISPLALGSPPPGVTKVGLPT